MGEAVIGEDQVSGLGEGLWRRMSLNIGQSHPDLQIVRQRVGHRGRFIRLRDPDGVQGARRGPKELASPWGRQWPWS